MPGEGDFTGVDEERFENLYLCDALLIRCSNLGMKLKATAVRTLLRTIM
jgi:hypothetical protein